jgi:hypothetical protein
MASVTLKKADLDAKKPCAPWYLESPEWDKTQEALVYKDFDATVRRLLASNTGRERLKWLVRHALVPMKPEELKARIASRRAENRNKMIEGAVK